MLSNGRPCAIARKAFRWARQFTYQANWPTKLDVVFHTNRRTLPAKLIDISFTALLLCVAVKSRIAPRRWVPERNARARPRTFPIAPCATLTAPYPSAGRSSG